MSRVAMAHLLWLMLGYGTRQNETKTSCMNFATAMTVHRLGRGSEGALSPIASKLVVTYVDNTLPVQSTLPARDLQVLHNNKHYSDIW
jgi:hypothetical protein